MQEVVLLRVICGWKFLALLSLSMCARATPYKPGTPSLLVNTTAGVEMPRLVYGTVWEKNSTAGLVVSAVSAGFRGLDAAGLPGFSFEQEVGNVLKSMFAFGVPRDSFFIQTKINPFIAAELNPGESIAKQVELSINTSLSHLKLEYVDSLLLHEPCVNLEHEQTMEFWRAMEHAVRAGSVRQLGLSEVSLEQLQRIYAHATLKPAVVQQRFYAFNGFEYEMRAWCAEVGIYFQAFWTLNENMILLASAQMQSLAKRYRVKPYILFMRWMLGLGVLPLTGTRSPDKMKVELSAGHLVLAKRDYLAMDELFYHFSATGADPGSSISGLAQLRRSFTHLLRRR